MKTRSGILLLLLFSSFTLRAQLLQSITAREYLADVESKAQAELATDAYTTNVLFVAVAYQGVGLTMDPQTGKATGWLYRSYSPSLDSVDYFIAVKPRVGQVLVLRVETDTITTMLPFNVGTTPLVEPWVDSPEALAGSLSGGADAFLQSNPGAALSVAVLVNNPVANPVVPLGEYWLLVYTAPADTMTCLVWGDSGDPLRCGSINAPHFVSIPNLMARVGEAYACDMDATGNPAPTYRLTIAPAGMTIDSASGLIAWTPSAAQTGPNPVTVRAANVRGSDEQSFIVIVQEGARAPHITSTPPVEVDAGEQYMYTVTATGSPAPTYTLAAPPPGMVLDGARGVLYWTPSRAQAGEHAITIMARNSAGSDTQRYVLSVYASPLLQTIAAQTAKVDSPFTLTLTAAGYPAPTYSLMGAKQGMTIDPASGVMSWTPSAQQTGLHTVVAEARNRAGFQQQPFTIDVSLGTAAVEAPQAADLQLLQSIPNPGSIASAVLIPYGVARAGWLRLSLYDAAGRLVSSFDEGYRVPGRHTARLSTAGLAAGSYRYVLSSGALTVSRWLTLR